jgi:hypothetical protein
MAKQKFDGVVESVHYKPNGEVDWVRAYERRGPTFSDHLLIPRLQFIQRLKSGKKFMAGRRVLLMGSTFELSHPIRLVVSGGKEVLVAGAPNGDQDRLEGVPII